MQSVLRLIFPPQCIGCGALVEDDFGLCGPCWRETPFITGLICDSCGVPLMGDPSDRPEHCDDCLTIVRPWEKGRAPLIYRGGGRKLVLALKHGDRQDLIRPAGRWMADLAPPLLDPDTVIAPVPAHYWRFVRRRYNQAALLAIEIGRRTGHTVISDLLRRPRATKVQDGMGVDQRFANLSGAIRPGPNAARMLAGRSVLLIDDVMTSGATLSAATEACHVAGAAHVNVLVLARVAKDA